ncbi:MAG: YqhA family protein [Anaerolineales bacterium]
MVSTLFRIHYVAIIAVVGSLFGAVLMTLIGAYQVILAFIAALGIRQGLFTLGDTSQAVGLILESVDSFLLGFILLYFAYSMYFLVTLPEERRQLGRVKMPSALKVANLDEMKRTILIVIVVSLSIFLLQEVTIAEDAFSIPDLFVPVSILAIALAVRLIQWDTRGRVSDDDEISE